MTGRITPSPSPTFTAEEHAQSEEEAKIRGLIGHHHLAGWWLRRLTRAERDYIASVYRPMGADGMHLLTEETITATSESTVDFLFQLATWLRRPGDQYLARRLRDTASELARTSDERRPGYHQGRHYATFAEEILDLKRTGNLSDARRLLRHLIEAMEAESQMQNVEVSPWYYTQMADVLKRIGGPDEVAESQQVLARYDQQKADFAKRQAAVRRPRRRGGAQP